MGSVNHCKVSVVIPTHDRAVLLEAAVRSLLLQTHRVDQIVIVDDGSSDAESVRNTAALDPAIEVVRHESCRGVAAARNSGIARVNGEFILFLDDDDLIHPRFVEDGLAVLAQRQEADIVVFLAECFFVPENLGDTFPTALLFNYRHLSMQPLRLAEDGNPPPPGLLESRPASAFVRFTIPIHSCLMRRSALGDRRFPESLKQGEDTYFWISLAQARRRFVFDDRVYAFVRRHRGNTTRSRARYRAEIQPCYELLLADRLLTDDDDVFLAHLKLFLFKGLGLDHSSWRHGLHLVARPRQLAAEGWFWLANLWARRRLLHYYLD